MRYFVYTSTVAWLLIAAACGSKTTDNSVAQSSDTIVVVEHDELRQAVERHDRKSAASMADQLALNADDLSAKEAVSVLMAFYDQHLQYQADRKIKSDMEAMRKFVDVYDIVKSNHGNEFISALGATTKVYPEEDFTQVYIEFVEKLGQYDGGGLSDKAPEADTIAVDSAVQEDLPPELRPAL